MLTREVQLTTSSNYPSSKGFLIEVPLYEVVKYGDADLELGRQVVYFDETFDSIALSVTRTVFLSVIGGKRNILAMIQQVGLTEGCFQ
jgi:hypothetical protein